MKIIKKNLLTKTQIFQQCILSILFLSFCKIGFADRYICPNTYKTVVTGNSISQVIAACGNPTSQTSKESEVNEPENIVQWIYTLQNVSQENINQYTPQLVVAFSENKVQQITSNHFNANAMSSCYYNNRIMVGDSSSDVIAKCGPPTYTTTIQQASSKKTTVTELIYNFGAYQPSIIFTFQDDTLVQIRMGTMK